MDKRRDKKGRVLNKGEVQRADGRYSYAFIDDRGERKYVYSWRLLFSDPTPVGKKEEKCLRELEEEIENYKRDGIVPYGGDCDVITLVKRYLELKRGVKNSTRLGYRTVVKWLENDPFGRKRIDTVTISDAKILLINLQEKQGKSYSSIHTIRGVLRPAFQVAVDDDLIRKNPFNFELADVVVNDSVRRDAITKDQMRRFLDFAKNDSHYCRYYDGFYILFHTGMRISEFCGLTIKDVDLNKKEIHINHQLMRIANVGYYIETTKTECGNRVIPMSDEVAECFRRVLNKRGKRKKEKIIGGYAGFIFLDKDGNPEVALHWEHHFLWCLKKYNRTFKEELPSITPHVCRHTYCSIMAKSGMNPKVLQYLMGHSDISVTLNVYTHVNLEDAKKELKKIASSE